MSYDFQAIEKKWKKEWAEHPIAQSKPTGVGKKYYCLDMFPYPSGSGLHVGHWRGYVLSDVYSRVKWLEGYNVLHPMGWDAFGLPAENDAIKKGIHPKVSTAKNIAKFKEQLQDIGAMYDWRKEINTTDHEYYKWTQWIFLQMYTMGLAYEDTLPINWCISCLTGLANEEVVDGACERCGSPVEKKDIRQWVLKITDYAEKLLKGLDTLEWPDKVKAMQRNWIGKSEGVSIVFKTKADTHNAIELPAFTTRPDTIFGVSFLVVAPDAPVAKKLITPEQQDAVNAFYEKMIAAAADDPHHTKEKYGIFTGSYAVNPATQKPIPIYLANYVLANYGTGIVMGVPCDDERDKEFAEKYAIAIPDVIDQENYTLINSEQFDGLKANTPETFNAIVSYLESLGVAERMTTYKLRDWIFSRQRYWGEPIPLIHCPKDGIVPVPEKDLPVMLPDVKKYEPTGTGQSPLAAIASWVNVKCPVCGRPAKRETNTMPQWAGSCWYFLRYPNPNLDSEPFDKKDVNYWLPVDLYVGGIEHAILHLLYARFYTHVLHDAGYVPFSEPFKQLFNQGMVLKRSKSGLVEKMSKSKGNVVNPDEIVEKYGSDTLRLYMLFIGPPELDCEWQDSGLEGIKRFLNRVWNYYTNPDNILDDQSKEPAKTTKLFHVLLKEFQNRLDHFKPNTAIAAMMEWLNQLYAKQLKIGPHTAEQFLIILSTMAPFMASELLHTMFGKSLADCTWPQFDPAVAQDDEITIIVQVNGKVRATIVVPKDASREQVEPLAREAIARWFEGKKIRKIIFVPNRLINFVVS